MISWPRAALLVVFVSVGAYANSLGNGFAYDDEQIVVENPNVSSPSFDGIISGPYWPDARGGSGLYRPVSIGVYAAQWWAFGGRPAGFHASSVVMHTIVCLLLLALLARLAPLEAALVGALVFAVHPVHVEAVANVVGQSELVAAVCVLLGCWLYLAGKDWEGIRRGARLAGLPALYGVGLGAKEIAVTLPLLLLSLDALRTGARQLPREVARELPIHLMSAMVLGAYLMLRLAAVGTLTGESAAPALADLTTASRWMTALATWPQYARLLLFPLDLSADYSPAVLLPATTFGLDVVAGLITLGLAAWTLWACSRHYPLVSLGIAWFCVSILPVANLVVPTGIILAERTLYLPSVGLSLAVAGVVAAWPESARRAQRTLALGAAVAVGALLTVRTVLRSPTWFDSYTVLNTLALEHPESFQAAWARASGLARVGDIEGAREAYETALALAPGQVVLATQVAQFHGSIGSYQRAEEILRRVTRSVPAVPEPHMLLADHLLLQGRWHEAHAAALRGIAAIGADPRLFARLAESYVARGDLEAAVRARLAAVGQDPEPATHWARIAQLYEAMGRADDATIARARASESPAPMQ